MEQITTVGVDLAKNVFSLHGVDGAGKTVLRRTVRRERLVETRLRFRALDLAVIVLTVPLLIALSWLVYRTRTGKAPATRRRSLWTCPTITPASLNMDYSSGWLAGRFSQAIRACALSKRPDALLKGD